MSTVEVSSVSPEEFLKLEEELKQLQRDQAAGLLDKPQGSETKEQFELRVNARCRRGIEITSILRRTNTGPAAPKGRKKKDIDIEGLAKNLLG